MPKSCALLILDSTVLAQTPDRATIHAHIVHPTHAAVTGAQVQAADASLQDITLKGGTTANINIQLNVARDQTEITVTGVEGEVRTDPTGRG